jgi:molybdopterin molybdotransferase
MLAFEEARARLLADVRRLGAERVPLAGAAGRVLARDLIARAPLPPFDNSAMDGYAVATGDFAGDGPWTMRVEGESSAGKGAPTLAAGCTCRIFTGAPIPSRADAVVMQEHVTRSGEHVTFTARPKAGANVRRAGGDLARGAVALTAGTRLSAGALALAAMLDDTELVVTRKPLVTIVCTGDELRAPGEPPRDASIPESNSAPLATLAAQAGAIACVAPIAHDDPASTLRAIEEALRATDLLVTVGGVSVGDRDVVRPALERAGVTIDFWRVAIKPGKPLAVGRSKHAHVLGLPGNPASAIVTFALFGVPLLRAMQGDARPVAKRIAGRLQSARKRSPDRLEFVRATWDVADGALVVRPHDNQSSGAATSLASSDGLALIPAGDAPIDAGSVVEMVPWSEV